MAGSNPFFDDKNLEHLTIEEHAETHMWLWMWFGNEYDRIAWKCLSGIVNNKEATQLAQKESGRRVAEFNKNRVISTEEKISRHAKISKSLTGKRLSESHRENIGNAQIGKKHSEETTRKRNASLRGKRRSAKVKEEQSLRLSGKYPKNFERGRPKGIESHKKSWIVTSPVGEVFVLKGLVDHCEKHGLSTGRMCDVGKGRLPDHKGWKCEKAIPSSVCSLDSSYDMPTTQS